MTIPYPRPEVWRLAYNVTPYEIDPEGVDDEVEYFRSAESVPPWDESEHDELQNWVFSMISSYLTVTSYPVLTELHERALSGYCISESNGTRTLFINVVFDPGIVAPEWVLHLQQELAENWPYWRVRIAYWEFGVEPAVSAPHDILIYPDAIFVGQRPPAMDVEKALVDWRDQFVTLYRQTNAVKRRRLRWLERETPRHIGKLAEKPFSVVAVYRDLHENRDMINVLFRGGSASWTIRMTAELTGKEVERWENYAVTPDGQLGEATDDWPDVTGIRVFGIPCAPSHNLAVCRIENPATDHIKYVPEFSFAIAESEIVSDEYLAEWESTLDQ